MEQSLLLFSPDCPSRDEETFLLAGEDPSALVRFQQSGMVSLAYRALQIGCAGMTFSDITQPVGFILRSFRHLTGNILKEQLFCV